MSGDPETLREKTFTILIVLIQFYIKIDINVLPPYRNYGLILCKISVM